MLNKQIFHRSQTLINIYVHMCVVWFLPLYGWYRCIRVCILCIVLVIGSICEVMESAGV